MRSTSFTRFEFLGSMLAAAATPHALLAAPATILSLKRFKAYEIVVPDSASDVEQHAAEVLQQHMAKVAGTAPTIRNEASHRKAPAIFVGHTHAAEHAAVAHLEQDGYAFVPVKQGLVVTGSGNGVLYGVYQLLEHWGFRLYASNAAVTPSLRAVSMPAQRVFHPQVRYRTTSYRDTRDAQYTAWQALDSRADWGLFVHTFNDLLSPDEYGQSHPEYFSLRNGKRVPGTQLCLSNPDVLTLVSDNLRSRIAARPQPRYWSVSQNDDDQYCQCDRCTALNMQYGNVPSGSILWFVNQVARQFPDKTVSTLAYWYSRTPPQKIQAERNVNIMLCNIESRRHAPVYETDPAFTKDLTGWGKLAKDILIWDYTIQFANLVSPFPNLHTLKPNIEFYRQNNVNALFMQANGQGGGEFAALRAYMLCKLMWDPKADDRGVMVDFLDGYYGPGGQFVLQYIDTMRQSLAASGFKLDIFGSPEAAGDAYLSAPMMQTYNALFDQAEHAAAQQPVYLQRVQAARLPLLYAAIQIGRNQEVDAPRGMFALAADGKPYARPEFKAMVQQFVAGCKADGVTRTRERSTPPEEYGAAYERIFTRMEAARQAPSLSKAITFTTPPQGGEANGKRLTSGIFGSFESWSAPDIHWVQWKGAHADFVLDLGTVMPIKTIRMDFLNAQAQPDWNTLMLPLFVSYAVSNNNRDFEVAATVQNPHNPNPKVNPDISKVPWQMFQATLADGTQGRYVRVHAESMLHMPPWHIRAGAAALLCTDQIVIT